MLRVITPEKACFPKPRRNYALDVLRGVLAWVVVLVHVMWFAGYTHSGLRGWLGLQAVQVFMMVSGYVTIATYRPEPYGRYLAKRLFRLAPVLAVCWALAWVARSGLTPAWFVTLVAQFYLVAPAIMRAVSRYGRRVLGALFAASLFFLLPPVHDWMERFAPMGEFLPMNLAYFLAGMLAFHLLDPAALAELSDRCARLPFWVRLGELSYCTYLVHWPLLAMIGYIVPSSFPNPARMALIALAGAPVTWVASVLLHRWVELPWIQLSKQPKVK